MIDAIYLAQLDAVENSTGIESIAPSVIETVVDELQKGGLFYMKTAGRFELVKTLPKHADSFNDMFDYADAYGKLRFAYIDSAHKISNDPKHKKKAAAVGGELGIKTALYHGFGINISGYISQSVGPLNPKKNDINEDFFNAEKSSFVYIAEASFNYSNDTFQTMLGRIKVETPYANSDDIRMAPDTFEGAWVNIDYTDKLKTQIMYVNKWAGYDSQDEDTGASQDVFKNLVNDDAFGMAMISLTYEYADNSEISIWYNYIDAMSIVSYAEIIGLYRFNKDFHIDYGFQASNFQELENSEVDGNVLGTMLIAHYNNYYIGSAYNIVLVEDGNYISNGFGGGPYYTSLDEATIEAISEATRNNSEAFRIGVGCDFSPYGAEGLNVELVYGELYEQFQSLKEDDIVITYSTSDRWSLDAIYTNFKSRNDNDNNTFDRYHVRVDYNF